MAKALGKTTRVAAEPPVVVRNERHQDIRLWLISCTDFFDRNKWQWTNESHRVRYALSKMDGPEVAPFALIYRQKMTGELGFVKEESYRFRRTFAKQAIRRFRPTHEAEKALHKMSAVRYQGHIAKFVLEMENLNIHAKMSEVAWRK